MKKKAILGLIAVATVGTAVSTSALHHNSNNINKVLLSSKKEVTKTNEAVVINGNNRLVLFGTSYGKGIISYLSQGEMLWVLGEQNGYYKVKVQETGAVGYISSTNIKRILNCEGLSISKLTGVGTIVNVSSAVNLRASAGINSSILGKLHNGQSVILLGKQGQWYKIDRSGQIAYIYEEYISTNKVVNSINANKSKSIMTSRNIISSHTAKNSQGTTVLNSDTESTKVKESKNVTLRTNGSSNSEVEGIVNNNNNNNNNNSDNIKGTPGTNSKKTTSEPTRAVNTKNSIGYSYGTSSELANISGNYLLSNFTKGSNTNCAQYISGVTINSNGVVLDNDINGNNVYSSSDRMKVYPTTASEFKILFGVTPESLGLEGNNFKVDAIGNVFIYQLPNKNIVFSFENIAGFAINNSNAIKPSNISNWYGTYTIKNKVGQINGFNSYGIKSINLTGKKVVIGANEFKYGTTVIQNPQYYIFKVNPNSLNGNGTYSGIELTNGEGYFLAVLGKNYKMTNILYDALPSYIGCTSGAWAANIAMPIILAPNGTIQVMNNNEEFYSTIKNS